MSPEAVTDDYEPMAIDRAIDILEGLLVAFERTAEERDAIGLAIDYLADER